MFTQSLFERFHRDRGGNVLTTFALSLLPIMVAAGAAVDYTESYRLHARAADATDAALLAASAAVLGGEQEERSPEEVLADLRLHFLPFFQANMPDSGRYAFKSYDLQYNPDSLQVTASVAYDYNTTMLGIVGRDTVEINITSQTSFEESVNGAMSMFLVLDRSGSMGWNNRMNALKQAVNQLALQFNTTDPSNNFIRLGAVAYNSYTWGHQGLVWGADAANQYTQNMWPGGGTNSSGAVWRAWRELRHQNELDAHQERNGQVPRKVMVFMTDGKNNYSWANTQTINNCNSAKNEGIEIYTVAFQAPWQGRQLLQNCATDSEHYFNANNAQQLIDAFQQIGSATAENLVLSR